MKLLINALLAAVLLSSCADVKYSYSNRVELEEGKASQTVVVYDLEVTEQKISGFAKGELRKIEDIKMQAIENAIVKGGCDELVTPVYEVVENDQLIMVTVTGYPAKYANFKTLDYQLLIKIQEERKGQNTEQAVNSNTEVKINDKRLFNRGLFGFCTGLFFSLLYFV
jgi:hypothetical protein